MNACDLFVEFWIPVSIYMEHFPVFAHLVCGVGCPMERVKVCNHKSIIDVRFKHVSKKIGFFRSNSSMLIS